MTHTNSHGQPIHQPPFMKAIEEVRGQVVGRWLIIHDDIPTYHQNHPAPAMKCVEVNITPDADHFNFTMEDGRRYGACFPAPGEEVVTGPNILGLKVNVLSGRRNRWVELTEELCPPAR